MVEKLKMGILSFIMGFGIGFLIASIFAGRKEGSKPRLILKTERHDYHFHHWIIALIVLIILFATDYGNSFIYGLVIGIIIQGLTYRDFHEIRTKVK